MMIKIKIIITLLFKERFLDYQFFIYSLFVFVMIIIVLSTVVDVTFDIYDTH